MAKKKSGSAKRRSSRERFCMAPSAIERWRAQLFALDSPGFSQCGHKSSAADIDGAHELLAHIFWLARLELWQCPIFLMCLQMQPTRFPNAKMCSIF